MNSKIIFDHMRPKLGVTQEQFNALFRMVNDGAKIGDIAKFVGLTEEKVENKTKGHTLTERDLQRLEGVHPDLVKVVKRAIEISEYDFMVVEGLRNKATQSEYVKKGVSQTMNSRHLVGQAVDLAPLENGSIDWNNKKGQFDSVAKAMLQAAKELNVKITWGGNWKSLVDKPHFQIENI